MSTSLIAFLVLVRTFSRALVVSNSLENNRTLVEI